MTIKQSAAFLVLMAAVTLAGAGCLARPSADTRPSLLEADREAEQAEPEEPAAAPTNEVDPSAWVRYDASQAGQIGMSFLYPPELAPVAWDTEAWGADAVGTDFTGFGVARIPNVERLTVAEWLARNYSDFAFDLSPVARDDAFAPAVPPEACEAYVVTDDFSEDTGLSGIGGTVFVNVGDASLYAFTLGQDWNQELGDRVEVIRAAMETVEWFAERTSCEQTTTVRDDRTGISFDLPSALAPVIVDDEYGWGTEETQDVENFTCLAHRAYMSRNDQTDSIFLAVKDTWECDTLGRGGYWGDQASQFATEDAIREWCEDKDSCDTFVNKNGITIYHAHSNQVDDWGATLSNVDEYAAWNDARSMHGVLLSNQNFIKENLDLTNETLRAIANSLSFVE